MPTGRSRPPPAPPSPTSSRRSARPRFARSERQVIARLLRRAPGPGARRRRLRRSETRALVRERALSIWLRADLDVLVGAPRRPRQPSAARGRRSARKAGGAARAAGADLCRGRSRRRQRQGADQRRWSRGSLAGAGDAKRGHRERSHPRAGRSRRSQLRHRGRRRACCDAPASELAPVLGARDCVVVTDEQPRRSGHLARLEASLRSAPASPPPDRPAGRRGDQEHGAARRSCWIACSTGSRPRRPRSSPSAAA